MNANKTILFLSVFVSVYQPLKSVFLRRFPAHLAFSQMAHRQAAGRVSFTAFSYSRSLAFISG